MSSNTKQDRKHFQNCKHCMFWNTYVNKLLILLCYGIYAAVLMFIKYPVFNLRVAYEGKKFSVRCTEL